MNAIVPLSLRNVRRNVRRSLLSGLAVFFAAVVIVAYAGLMTGMDHDSMSSAINYGSGHLRIVNAKFLKYRRINPIYYNVPRYKQVLAFAKNAKRYRGIDPVFSPRVELPSMIYNADDPGRSDVVNVLGLDQNSERGFNDLLTKIYKGSFPESGKYQILVGSAMMAQKGYKIGDKVTVSTITAMRAPNYVTFTIVGAVHAGISLIDNNVFITSLKAAQMFGQMQRNNAVSEILVKYPTKSYKQLTDDYYDQSLLIRRRVKLVSPDLTTRDWREDSPIYSGFKSKDRVMSVIYLIFALLGSAVILNTMIMSVLERQREIGIMSSLGFSKRSLVSMFTLEGVWIALIGALLGTLVGYCVVLITGHFGVNFSHVANKMNVGMPSYIYPFISPLGLLYVFLLSFLAGTLASWIPSLRSSKIDPVDALRSF